MTSRPVRIFALAVLLGWLLVGSVHLHAPDAPRTVADCLVCGSVGHAAALNSSLPVFALRPLRTPMGAVRRLASVSEPANGLPTIRGPPLPVAA